MLGLMQGLILNGCRVSVLREVLQMSETGCDMTTYLEKELQKTIDEYKEARIKLKFKRNSFSKSSELNQFERSLIEKLEL